MSTEKNVLGTLMRTMEHFVKTNTFPDATKIKELQDMLGEVGSMREIMKQLSDSKVGPGGCHPQLEGKMEEVGKERVETENNRDG